MQLQFYMSSMLVGCVCPVVCVACRVLRFNNVSLSFKDLNLHYKAEIQWMDTLFITGKWGCIHRKHR